MKLTNMKAGKWIVKGGMYDGARIVRVHTSPSVWEIQDEFGSLLVQDGFESLSHVREWLNICEE